MANSVGGAPLVVSHSPQNPSDVVGTAPAASRSDVAAAAVTARKAQAEWWSAGAARRSAALKNLSTRLAAKSTEVVNLIVREVGKPLSEARGEVARAISILDFYAQQPFAPLGNAMPGSMPGRLWTERRPHGVAGLITPWNFPLAIPLWKAAPALAAGNAILFKPSPDAVASALWLQELTAGILPDGLFQALPGDGPTGVAVVESSDVVSFTGSEFVGRQVALAATTRGVPVQAEMGGQNAAIILADADAESVAAMVMSASMGFAGQKCTATRRIVLVGSEARRREVKDALVAAALALNVGDPTDAAVTVGPVINQASRARVTDAAALVCEAGGRMLCGGEDMARDGWFVTPGLAEGLEADHLLCQEEVFGPFAVLLDAADVDHAVRLAEGVRYGLVTSVHGRDAGQLLAAVDAIGTGMIKVNAPSTGVDFYAPFGGERDSSYGPREQGPRALDFYTSTRTITFSPHA